MTYNLTSVIYNNTNPYPEKFLELLSKTKGLILDCGSGDRRLNFDKLVNLDITPSKGVDVIGDSHRLPFKDNSFDLILSQATLEHCKQPFTAADELYRVCNKNGIIYAEAAFMQPFHAVPYHFFNMTILGIEELFSKFEKIESGAFDGLSITIPWMINCTSASKNKILLKILLKIIHRLDATVKPHELKNIASGVYFLGIKRDINSNSHKLKKINSGTANYAIEVKAEDKIVTKIGKWTISKNLSALSRSLVMSNTPGDKLSFSFKGQSKIIYFLKHNWSGIAEIYLDGTFFMNLDLYHKTHQYGFDFVVEGKSEEKHTLDVVVSGKKNSKSNDCQIWVDGFGSS